MRLGSILVVALAALLLAAAAHGYGLLQLTDQCASRVYNLTHQVPAPGYVLVRAIISKLDFAVAGTAHLVIKANVSSNAPVQLVIYDSQLRTVWATWPSMRIVGTYTVDLEAPGFYELLIRYRGFANVNFTAFINVTMCSSPTSPAIESWLRQYIKPTNMTLDKVTISAAPMGIVSYGVMEVDGRYFAYNLTTDAVRGVAYIPPNIPALGYYWIGSYGGQAFSVQLNAFVVARLKDGAVQYYWTQNVVRPDIFKERLEVRNSIWNVTDKFSILDKSAVSGKGKVYSWLSQYEYDMPGSIPFGRVELETWVRVDNGKIIVEFYVNGQKYDEVTITPYAPATSAYIAIAPAITPTGFPLDLELVFTGYSNSIPLTVLKRGQIRLELYVRMNGAWVPPPSAWSIGPSYIRFGDFPARVAARVEPQGSHASVVPQGVGSALVVPGEPNPQQLWAGTVIATPFGINATNSTDLSPHASPIEFANGTRLVLAEAYVNGRPAQSLSNVTLGSLVVLQYKRQYFVSISAPGNYTAGWFDENSTIVIDEPPVVDIGNGTRLVNPLVNGTAPPLVIVVDRPLVVAVSYASRQYLVSLNSPINNTAVWANASSAVVLNLPPVVDFDNGTRLVDPLVNGTRPPLVVEVNRPMSFVGTYTKQYLVTYSGPTWLNRTWVNANASMVFNPPQIIDFGNNTRLINPLISGAKPPLSITVDKPISLSVEYARQYLVSVSTPFNNTSVWINAGASYAPPASTISTDGVTFVPAHLTIDGRRAPLAPVPVESPLDITVHYNAYAEVPTTFAGLPALYAEASIACGGTSNSTSGLFASSLRLELIDAPAGTCSISKREVPLVVPIAILIIVALIIALIRRR